MSDWVDCLLRAVYAYGHLIGLSNFELDWTTLRVFTSRRCTIYASALNIVSVVLLAYYYSSRSSLNVIFANANKLHEYVIIAMIGLRTLAGTCQLHDVNSIVCNDGTLSILGVTTMINRWRQRRQMMQLLRNVVRLYLSRPQVKRIVRWAILVKILIIWSTDLLQILITADAMDRMGAVQFLGMVLQFAMAALLNLAMTQHYLVMLIIRANYLLINAELRKLIDECKHLSYHSPRNGVFMTRCCFLADQLDGIGRHRDKLQTILEQLAEVFGVQGLIVYTGYYMFMVSTTYLSYSIFKHGPENLGMTLTSEVLSFSWCILYYLDALINLQNMILIQDDHEKMVHLLEERILFAPGLDVRLEESFENIQLQVIRKPMKMHVMNLFPINRSSTSSMLGSLVMNSIYLIQYDMENF
ncbi:hypothetical protein KR018_012373 [Drosophila ironensis]|nr:hypothetical protein KR018_012373 [Drosophila ironensis]